MIEEDLWRLGQLQAGQSIQLVQGDTRTAIAVRQAIERWLQRLRVSVAPLTGLSVYKELSMKIDVNSDMGEGFGVYQLCDDSALMDRVSSANIACGFHAGIRRS